MASTPSNMSELETARVCGVVFFILQWTEVMRIQCGGESIAILLYLCRTIPVLSGMGKGTVWKGAVTVSRSKEANDVASGELGK